ncbi:MAG: Cytochrome c-type biogenesis protein CcmE [Chloroflexi bacterium]|nr:Cytochrome c-type biogenesis protein CcmE [Chloroflexota bacterium]
MANTTQVETTPQSGGKAKFIIGGVLIIAAIVYLIVSSASANAQYFLTVEEALEKSASGELDGRNLRISGAVIGDTIQYDSQTLKLSFMIAHVPGDNKDLEAEGGLATALHNAVNDPSRPRLEVVHEGPMPDLLQNEAQAIITGYLEEGGTFHADELLLKCPTKYEEAVPEQTG